LPTRRAINLRTLCLGSGLTILIAGFGPYNDFVVGNGFLIACYLPIVFVLCMFLLTVSVNAPLRRFCPAQALSGAELSVVGVMMLAACSIPNQGLLRAFLPALVHPFYHGQFDHQFWEAFTAMGLPSWLYPVGDIANGRNSPVMTWFYQKVPYDQAVPYSAWIRPLLGWGVFLVSLFAALVASAMLLYPQWAINERLPFPIAQVELALISEPERGRLFNSLYHSRLFWVGLAVAFLLQNQVAMHTYFPKHMPAIPLTYDFSRLMTSEPWTYLAIDVKQNAIVFLYIAMGFFVQGRVGFSVWAIYLMMEGVRVTQQMLFQLDTPADAILDQHLGASVVFIAGVFWVGRHHWKKTFTDPNSRSRLLLLIFLLGIAGMIGWLWMVGVGPAMCLLIIAFILLTHLVTARVVAETGLPVFRSYATSSQIYTRVNPGLLTGRDVYFAGIFNGVGAGFGTRESAAVFVQHALWIFHRSTPQPDSTRPRAPVLPRIGPVIAWAMLLSFVVGTFSSLHCYYNYARPISRHIQWTTINGRGMESLPTQTTADPLVQFSRGRFNPPNWNPAVHIGIGAGVTLVLLMLALRTPNWPLLPVGYILATTPFIGWCWYSIMIGWLAKVLILRFGGAKMYQEGKPLFIGLIVGEALAAAVWIIINTILASTGHDYQQIIFYPS
jgi:hypothetical protein